MLLLLSPDIDGHVQRERKNLETPPSTETAAQFLFNVLRFRYECCDPGSHKLLTLGPIPSLASRLKLHVDVIALQDDSERLNWLDGG